MRTKRDVQIPNNKCQLKSKFLISYFKFYHLDFGINLVFGFCFLSLKSNFKYVCGSWLRKAFRFRNTDIE